MRSSISSNRARSFTFRTVGAYYSNVMQAVWPPLALRSYGEGANMAQKGFPVAGSRVNQRTSSGSGEPPFVALFGRQPVTLTALENPSLLPTNTPEERSVSDLAHTMSRLHC